MPRSVPRGAIAEALVSEGAACSPDSPLLRFVDVGTFVHMERMSQNWYRTVLPAAAPFFGCMTHQAAVDIATTGLATCHCPLSLLPSLPSGTLDSLQFFELPEMSRTAVLAMPKHLTSLRPFSEFLVRMSEFAGKRYRRDMFSHIVQKIPA